MLVEDHIFSVKTKDPDNVADITQGGSGIVITGLNVLRDQIKVGDFVFVVFGGDKPKGWTPGLVSLAHVSREPYVGAGDEGKNFRIEIDVDLFFQPSVKRGDLISYPDTFDTIGIGPITKWEPNQALTAVKKANAVGLLQALCDIFPAYISNIRTIVGDDFALVDKPVRRFIEGTSKLGDAKAISNKVSSSDFSGDFCKWFAENRGRGSDKTAKKYLGYLGTITDEYQEPTHSYWHGLYKVMYGHDAEKRVVSIGELEGFEKIYGSILPALEKKIVADDLDAAGAQKAIDWFWQPEVKPHTCVTSALNAYYDFLEWRKSHCETEALPDDALSIALQSFKAHRGDPDWAYPPDKPDWGYVSVNKGTREYYDELKKNIDGIDLEKVKEMFLGVGYETKNITFKPMWSGSNGTGWDSIKKGLDSDPQKTIEWIQRYAKSAADVVVFATKADDDNRPSGFGKSVESELLMKFHPDVAIKCGTKTMEVLEKLHLMSFKREGTYDEWEYQQVLGIAADIKLRMDKLGITRVLEDTENADYLTVNEFIAWCTEKEDLIKEEIMKVEFKSVKEKRKVLKGDKKLKDVMKDELMQRLAAALRTKPFAILAGHSGTGKSQMVRRLAYMTCADKGLMAESEKGNAPGNYCMIQVKPNWHDSTELLGYYSEIGKKYRSTDFVRFVMKAYAYPEIPFFVCLDEMNLAPVEQYFAEYLSAIESASDKTGVRLTDPLLPKDYAVDEVADVAECRFTESKAWFEAHGLTLPRNLFVVGTVNMDDTTCQFSRKVLDRAMTIMMDQVKFEDMKEGGKSSEPSEADLLDDTDVEKFLDGKLTKKLVDDQVTLLNQIKEVLDKTSFAVAYRFANEYTLYEASLSALTGRAEDAALAKEALDHCVLMKVLPRVHGERKELELLFRGNAAKNEKGLESTFEKGTLSGDKMENILERKQVYLSFWP